MDGCGGWGWADWMGVEVGGGLIGWVWRLGWVDWMGVEVGCGLIGWVWRLGVG